MKRKTKSENPKPPGKPFQPGEDPRRHKGGSRPKSAVEFASAFNRAAAGGGDPEALAASLWKRALAGHAWAANTLLERLLGKPVQAVAIAEPPRVIRLMYGKAPDVSEEEFELCVSREVLDDGTKVIGSLYEAESEARLDAIQTREGLMPGDKIDELRKQRLAAMYPKPEEGKDHD